MIPGPGSLITISLKKILYISMSWIRIDIFWLDPDPHYVNEDPKLCRRHIISAILSPHVSGGC